MQLLKPFTPHNDPIQVEAEASLSGSELVFDFRLTDPSRLALDSLEMPPPKGKPERVDGLSKTTCLEAFWARPGEASYWELNLSPSGKFWNLYQFDEYRRPQPPRASLDFELSRLEFSSDRMRCTLLGKTELAAIELSLCVIVRTGSAMHFYAIDHRGPKPDFHLRNSFCLNR